MSDSVSDGVSDGVSDVLSVWSCCPCLLLFVLCVVALAVLTPVPRSSSARVRRRRRRRRRRSRLRSGGKCKGACEGTTTPEQYTKNGRVLSPEGTCSYCPTAANHALGVVEDDRWRKTLRAQGKGR